MQDLKQGIKEEAEDIRKNIVETREDIRQETREDIRQGIEKDIRNELQTSEESSVSASEKKPKAWQEHFRSIFTIHGDSASPEEVRDRIFSAGKVTETNLVILIMAIMVASIGLLKIRTTILVALPSLLFGLSLVNW